MTRPAVLIVEPRGELRQFLAEGLAERGYEVVPTVDRDEALRFAEGLGASLVVTSSRVPDFGDGAVLDHLAARGVEVTLLILGEEESSTRELSLGLVDEVAERDDRVLLLPVDDLEPAEILRRVRLVLVGWELGVEPDSRLQSLVGELAHLPILELARGLGRIRVDGRVLTGAGELVFAGGELVAATAWLARGAKAFQRVARLREGRFRVILGRPGVGRQIERPLAELIIEAIESLAVEMPGTKARVEVVLGPSFFDADFDPSERALLEVVQEGPTVAALLDRLEATDAEILTALETLVERGAVRLVEPEGTVRVVTDSTSDLPRDLARDHGIRIAPLMVHLGERLYRDGVDLGPKALYEHLSGDSSAKASTSPPTVGELREIYESIVAERDVVSIHLSSALSECLDHARQAAEQGDPTFQGLREGPDPVVVELVDSRQVSAGLGLLALFASRMAHRGLTAPAIAERLRGLGERIHLLFVVDSLDHLARGGRIGKAQAFVGGLLGIKPILGVEDGEVAPVARVRGGRAAHPKIIELLGERVDPERPVVAAVGHAAAPVWADRLRSLLEERFRVEEVVDVEIGPTVGVHAGPGTVGAAVFQPEGDELELFARL